MELVDEREYYKVKMKPTEKLEVQRFMGSIICRGSRIIRSRRFVAFGRSERPKQFSTTGVSRKKDKKK